VLDKIHRYRHRRDGGDIDPVSFFRDYYTDIYACTTKSGRFIDNEETEEESESESEEDAGNDDDNCKMQ